MVAKRRQCTHSPTITPNKHALQRFTDALKEGWGAHLHEHTARGTWPLQESKLYINYLELKAVFLALKEFQDLCSDKIILVATDNTTVVSYINKEGGMSHEVSPTLCPTVENVDLVYHRVATSLYIVKSTLYFWQNGKLLFITLYFRHYSLFLGKLSIYSLFLVWNL